MSNLTTGLAENDPISDDAIRQANANLKNFSLVGVLEDMDDFERTYKRIFDTKLIIKKKNPSPLSKAKQQVEITDDIKSKVEELCQPNMRIYNSVLEQVRARK